jgi:hypothetical protein
LVTLDNFFTIVIVFCTASEKTVKSNDWACDRLLIIALSFIAPSEVDSGRGGLLDLVRSFDSVPEIVEDALMAVKSRSQVPKYLLERATASRDTSL